MSESIRFYYRGKVHTFTQGQTQPTQTILQHVREDLHCTGTKEGCAEGDCGACTVVIGELQNERLKLGTVNACIQFMSTLDGKALFTVKDLKQADGSLHSVQQAVVDSHGSQCGFCTPGFVMSLWSLYLEQDGKTEPPSRQEIDSALSGNLCRCTGYRPLIDAATQMKDFPTVEFDRAALISVLCDMQRGDMLVYTKKRRISMRLGRFSNLLTYARRYRYRTMGNQAIARHRQTHLSGAGSRTSRDD